MRIGLIAIVILTVGACSSGIQMHNPTTGATATCGPYSMVGGGYSAAVREAQCVRDYKEQGYVRK